MDITPHFTVFIAMIFGMLLEIPIFFIILHILGVRKYADATLGNVAMWAAALMVIEFYVGWRIAGYLDDDALVWLATVPAALLAVGICVFAYSLPVVRAVFGGIIFFGLHFWTIQHLPQPKVEYPIVLTELTETTLMRPAYTYDANRPEAVQWYSQLKAWQETRLLWEPFLQQFEKQMTDPALPVRIDQIAIKLMRDSENPNFEIRLDGSTRERYRSSAFKTFLAGLRNLQPSNSPMERIALDRFGPDLRVGAEKNTRQFGLHGFRYTPRPGNHEAMNGLSRNALQLGVGAFDAWIRIPSAYVHRNEWSRRRAREIVDRGNLTVSVIKPLKSRNVATQCGGAFLRALDVNIDLVGSYGHILKTVQQFESDPMTGWITRLDLSRHADTPGLYNCSFDIAWPLWRNYDIDTRIAQFLGKPVEPPVYDETDGDDIDAEFLRLMQQSDGYIPMPNQ